MGSGHQQDVQLRRPHPSSMVPMRTIRAAHVSQYRTTPCSAIRRNSCGPDYSEHRRPYPLGGVDGIRSRIRTLNDGPCEKRRESSAPENVSNSFDGLLCATVLPPPFP